jgi:cysteinyl-tRNA synthetase
VLQGHETIPDTTVDETVIGALFDDLNTAEALSALREVYLQAKSGTLDQRRKFATTLKFLGFRKIYSPGLFEDFINGRNTANTALIVHSETVQRLRAAYANAAPEEVKAALSQRILNDGLSVEFQNGETIVLVGTDTEFEERVNSLVENRLEARKAKDWKKSDEIRDELLAMGIQIKDNKDGTTSWEVKR